MKALIIAAFFVVCVVAVVAPFVALSLVVEPRMRRRMDAHERQEQR